MDSNSDMGLILRDVKQQMVSLSNTPHLYQVKNLDGKNYCQCGNMTDVETVLCINPGFTYEVVFLPPTPQTVNVPSTTLDPDLELPEQKILPQSDLQPVEL